MAAKLSGPTSGKSYTVEQNSDINVTPFVDIMLVLLIIFMVSIPMATVSIKLDAPPATHDPITDPRKPAVVMIQKDGNIYLAGATDKQTSLDNLAADLAVALKAEYPEKADPRDNAVFIRADADVKYEQFMDVLNKLQDTGYFKIGLVTEDIQ